MKPAPAGKEIARQCPGYREGRPEICTEEERRRTVQIASELSIRLTAKVTGISRSTVQRWVHTQYNRQLSNNLSVIIYYDYIVKILTCEAPSFHF